MSQPFTGLVRTVRALDGFAERCGAAVAWLMVPMLAASYALRAGAHIRTDFLWERWPVRTRGAIEAFSYILFFFSL